MNVLFFHPNFPAQYFYLAQHIAKDSKNKVFFVTKADNGVKLPGVRVVTYQLSRPVTSDIHGYISVVEEAILDGQAVYRSVRELEAQGFKPDVMIGHTGWGSSLYLKDLYPDVPLIGYFEWYYNAFGSDAKFWEDEFLSLNDTLRIRTKNLHHLSNLVSCDIGYCPTYWQKQQFPKEFHPKLEVIHEGVDTTLCCPKPEVKLVLEDISLDLSEQDEIITYVSRGFEPYRGFPQFMDAIRIVLANRPKCHVVIVGKDRTCYGAPSPDNRTYQQIEMDKGGLDMNRVHFVGLRNRTDYAKILQASTVHVYLTRPFILSWSLMESMAAGCCLVSSATPPVQEVITSGENGLLADFRSPKQIASQIETALDDANLREKLSKRARETIVDRYDLDKMLAKQMDLIYSQIK